ncbi:MAG: hypothetical protein ABR936_09420 [Bacteroidota bacterium]|jgi:hypothetical protein
MRTSLAFIISCFGVYFSVFSQNKMVMGIRTNENCIITDPFGRKTGVDSRYSLPYAQWKWLGEIPNATIDLNGIGDGNPDYIHFDAFSQTPDCDGIYKIELIGDYDSTNFMRGAFMRDNLRTAWLSISLFPWKKDQQVQVVHYNLKKIPIDRDSVVIYLFTYHSTPGGKVSLEKVVSSRSLIQDVSAMSKLGWIQSQSTSQDYIQLYNTVGSQISTNNISGARATLNTILNKLQSDSASAISGDACKLLSADTRQLLAQLPTAPPPGFNVKLVNSAGAKLTGGALQYYEGVWKDAVNNNDGTFSVTTNLKTISLRMTYEYGTQTKSNVSISNDTIVFQTVNAQIQLQNSQGTLIDQGTVQYYSGAWRDFGITMNGVTNKELLPNSYSFRMSYAYASKDKQQDIGTNATVVFQTVNANVQLQNGQGTLMDEGTVQYYSGAWRDLGTTTNGTANKELLPNNYSFRMTYAFASKDKQQDISTNAIVVFQTVNAVVQLKNSQGNLIDQGTVQYYSGAWRDLGTTTSGVANKELLPNNYSFRMTYAFASKDKQQDISTNATVIFQTVNAIVQLQNSQGSLIDQGTVQYYSGAWRDLGTTTSGVANKELLPNNYSFRMMYEYVSLDKTQDISSNNTVSFSTVLCTIRVKNSQNQLVDNALASYYSGAWRQIGNTVNGVITKELLPVNLSFRVKYGTQQQDKQQNLSTNNVVEFGIQ